MAGGIDWFRWHHGTVTDPKFALVARKAGASLPDVLAVWAFLLEKASAANVRGVFGDIDTEAVDCLYGFADGRTGAILAGLDARRLTKDGAFTAWSARQPKREREDDNAAERKRKQRAKSQPVTPSHATSRQETPRGEESREEQNLSPPEVNGYPGLSAAVGDASGSFEGHDVPRETPNPVAAFAVALNHAGFNVTSMNPDLIAYAAEGGTVEHLVECAKHPDCKGTKAGYPISMARRELKARAREVATGPPGGGRAGKTAQGIQLLEGLKHGLADAGNFDGVPKAALPRLGPPAGG